MNAKHITKFVAVSTCSLVAGLTILPLALTACTGTAPQRGGTASTMFARAGHSNSVTLAQSENPKEPSSQVVQSEQTTEYVLPAGTALDTGSPGGSSFGSDTDQTPIQTVARLQRAVPVRIVSKDRTETHIGGAQKDTIREWAGKAANLHPVMWTGIAMMTLGAGVLVYFGWWTKAAVAAGVGIAMIVLAQTLPEHGTAILFGGLGVFGVAALLVLYAYYKGQVDRNANGVPDFLEKKATPTPMG